MVGSIPFGQSAESSATVFVRARRTPSMQLGVMPNTEAGALLLLKPTYAGAIARRTRAS
jgi:hypothetical protein